MDNEEIIKVIIIDDNKECLFDLQTQLELFPNIQILGMASSYKSAKSLLMNEAVDLIFLDIEMPFKNGFDLLKEIREQGRNHFSVIFHTAYDKYMIEALREMAFDFLVKPVTYEDLKQAIERYKEKKENTSTNVIPLYQGLVGIPDVIALPTSLGMRFVDKSKILMFRCSKFSLMKKSSWEAVLNDQTVIALNKNTTSKDIAAIIDSANFVSINQSTIVNIIYINYIEFKTHDCVLVPPYNGISLNVSRTHLTKLRERFDML